MLVASKITYKHKLPYTCSKYYYGYDRMANEYRHRQMREFVTDLSEAGVKFDRPHYKINMWCEGYHIRISNEYVKFNNIDWDRKNEITDKVQEALGLHFDYIDYEPCELLYSVDFNGYYNVGCLRKLLIGNVYGVSKINYQTFNIMGLCNVILKGNNCLTFKTHTSNVKNVLKAYEFLRLTVIIPHLLLMGHYSSNFKFLVLDIIRIIIKRLHDLCI